ncbi:MAG TPA: cell division protein FtsL [Tissierellaceae bacterium]|nr:cell division protein FtsL [Tissierellaceae bacterium]
MSEARQLSYYPVEELEINRRAKKPIKKSKKIKKKNDSGIKILFLFFPVIICSICLLILFRYVNITSVRQEITSLENEVIDLEKDKLNLIGDLEGIKSSKKIAEDASLKLGMDYPTQDQIVYISVNETIAKEKPKYNSRLKRMLSIVGSMF